MARRPSVPNKPSQPIPHTKSAPSRRAFPFSSPCSPLPPPFPAPRLCRPSPSPSSPFLLYPSFFPPPPFLLFFILPPPFPYPPALPSSFLPFLRPSFLPHGFCISAGGLPPGCQSAPLFFFPPAPLAFVSPLWRGESRASPRFLRLVVPCEGEARSPRLPSSGARGGSRAKAAQPLPPVPLPFLPHGFCPSASGLPPGVKAPSSRMAFVPGAGGLPPGVKRASLPFYTLYIIGARKKSRKIKIFSRAPNLFSPSLF